MTVEYAIVYAGTSEGGAVPNIAGAAADRPSTTLAHLQSFEKYACRRLATQGREPVEA